MDTRFTLTWLLAIILTGALSLPASAGGIYKSVGADGAILFSDTPPGIPSQALAESEGLVARANAQIDLAEHALALARQGLASPHDGLRFVAARMTQSDGERVAFYMKDVRIACRQLMDLLRDRQSPLQLAVR